jgi:hypothetical protein
MALRRQYITANNPHIETQIKGSYYFYLALQFGLFFFFFAVEAAGGNTLAGLIFCGSLYLFITVACPDKPTPAPTNPSTTNPSTP